MRYRCGVIWASCRAIPTRCSMRPCWSRSVGEVAVVVAAEVAWGEEAVWVVAAAVVWVVDLEVEAEAEAGCRAVAAWGAAWGEPPVWEGEWVEECRAVAGCPVAVWVAGAECPREVSAPPALVERVEAESVRPVPRHRALEAVFPEEDVRRRWEVRREGLRRLAGVCHRCPGRRGEAWECHRGEFRGHRDCPRDRMSGDGPGGLNRVVASDLLVGQQSVGHPVPGRPGGILEREAVCRARFPERVGQEGPLALVRGMCRGLDVLAEQWLDPRRAGALAWGMRVSVDLGLAPGIPVRAGGMCLGQRMHGPVWEGQDVQARRGGRGMRGQPAADRPAVDNPVQVQGGSVSRGQAGSPGQPGDRQGCWVSSCERARPVRRTRHRQDKRGPLPVEVLNERPLAGRQVATRPVATHPVATHPVAKQDGQAWVNGESVKWRVLVVPSARLDLATRLTPGTCSMCVTGEPTAGPGKMDLPPDRRLPVGSRPAPTEVGAPGAAPARSPRDQQESLTHFCGGWAMTSDNGWAGMAGAVPAALELVVADEGRTRGPAGPEWGKTTMAITITTITSTTTPGAATGAGAGDGGPDSVSGEAGDGVEVGDGASGGEPAGAGPMHIHPGDGGHHWAGTGRTLRMEPSAGTGEAAGMATRPGMPPPAGRTQPGFRVIAGSGWEAWGWGGSTVGGPGCSAMG